MQWEGYERCYWVWELNGPGNVQAQISSERKATSGEYDWSVDIELKNDNNQITGHGILEIGTAESFEEAVIKIRQFLSIHGITLGD